MEGNLNNGLQYGQTRGLLNGQENGLYNGVYSSQSFNSLLKQYRNLNKNLIAYWKLDGNSIDSKGTFNGSDNAVSYSSSNGIIGQGAAFNGSTSLINVANSASSPFRQSSEITYSFWIKLQSGGLGRLGVASSGGQGSGGIIVSETSMTFNWTPTLPGSDRQYSASATLPAGKWHYIVFTMSFVGTTSAVFYLNGVPLTTTLNVSDVTNGVPVTSYNSNVGDAIGARFVNVWSYTSSSYDDVRLFSKRLTPFEVWQFYINSQKFQQLPVI